MKYKITNRDWTLTKEIIVEDSKIYLIDKTGEIMKDKLSIDDVLYYINNGAVLEKAS